MDIKTCDNCIMKTCCIIRLSIGKVISENMFIMFPNQNQRTKIFEAIGDPCNCYIEQNK
jgi:hypothetical protein